MSILILTQQAWKKNKRIIVLIPEKNQFSRVRKYSFVQLIENFSQQIFMWQDITNPVNAANSESYNLFKYFPY